MDSQSIRRLIVDRPTQIIVGYINLNNDVVRIRHSQHRLPSVLTGYPHEWIDRPLRLDLIKQTLSYDEWMHLWRKSGIRERYLYQSTAESSVCPRGMNWSDLSNTCVKSSLPTSSSLDMKQTPIHQITQSLSVAPTSQFTPFVSRSPPVAPVSQVTPTLDAPVTPIMQPASTPVSPQYFESTQPFVAPPQSLKVSVPEAPEAPEAPQPPPVQASVRRTTTPDSKSTSSFSGRILRQQPPEPSSLVLTPDVLKQRRLRPASERKMPDKAVTQKGKSLPVTGLDINEIRSRMDARRDRIQGKAEPSSVIPTQPVTVRTLPRRNGGIWPPHNNHDRSGFLDDGFLDDGFLDDGFLDDGFLDDGFLDGGFLGWTFHDDGFLGWTFHDDDPFCENDIV